MAYLKCRPVTLTLTLTKEEAARFACGGVVLDRIRTLAVVAVAPSPVDAP